MTSPNFNHLNLSEQAAFQSLTTPIVADGAVTAAKFGTQSSTIFQDLTYTAANGGTAGNSISITYVEDTLPGQESVTLSGTSLTIHIGSPVINITGIVDGTHLLVVSTTGMSIGDTITQGLHSTTIVAILGSSELQVISTSGFITGTALDNNLLSTATQVLTVVQNSYLSSFLVSAVVSGTPSNKQVTGGPILLTGGTSGQFLAGVFADSNPVINSGTLHLISGANVTLSQSGSSITINAASDLPEVTSLNGLTGALTLVGGSGISITPAVSTITIVNTGVTSITGTANQINVSASTGSVTLSTPQNIATTSSPTFSGVTVTNLFLTGVASDPGSPVAGQVWFNNTTNQYKGYDGTTVIILG